VSLAVSNSIDPRTVRQLSDKYQKPSALTPRRAPGLPSALEDAIILNAAAQQPHCGVCRICGVRSHLGLFEAATPHSRNARVFALNTLIVSRAWRFLPILRSAIGDHELSFHRASARIEHLLKRRSEPGPLLTTKELKCPTSHKDLNPNLK
jgi:hypothetical protein